MAERLTPTDVSADGRPHIWEPAAGPDDAYRIR
jgi:hypothetical protein